MAFQEGNNNDSDKILTNHNISQSHDMLISMLTNNQSSKKRPQGITFQEGKARALTGRQNPSVMFTRWWEIQVA
jgi:hypothetical protein